MKTVVKLLREIRDLLMQQKQVAYTIPEAAGVARIGVTKLREHIARGELAPSFIDSKPVILHDELERWLRERPNKAPH